MDLPYDSVDIGDYKRLAFDLKNQGVEPLKLSADFLSGSNQDFSLLSPLPEVVEPGARVRFEITFRPKEAGNKAAVFRILSNDPDQGTFDIQLTGFGFPFSVETPDGTDFDTTEVGESEVLEFVLVNNGSEPLENVSAEVSPESSAKAAAGRPMALAAQDREFTLISQVPRRLRAKERVKFQVMFKPRTSGERSVLLRVQSTKNKKRSLEIQIRGRGKLSMPRDIVIRNAQGDNLRSKGESVDFGSVGVGSKATRWFSIRNKTKKPLLVSRISVAGADADLFQIAGASNREIAPGALLRFQASCRPSNKGAFEAVFVIHSVYMGSDLPSVRIHAKGKAVAPEAGALAATSAARDQASVSAEQDAGGTELGSSGQRILRSTTWIQGLGYATVTITNPMAGGTSPVVEVSPDAIHWNQGERHTLVLESDSNHLVVRDLLPSGSGVQRHLRVRFVKKD